MAYELVKVLSWNYLDRYALYRALLRGNGTIEGYENHTLPLMASNQYNISPTKILTISIDINDERLGNMSHENLISDILGTPYNPSQGQGGIDEDAFEGVKGSHWYDGFGVPGNIGTSGDYFLNLQNGDVYKKLDTTWERRGNLKGAKGDKGEPGQPGKQGQQGLQGEKGEKGDRGAVGKSMPSSKWWDGHGNPSINLGNESDYYLNLDNADIYKKTSLYHWERIGNITAESIPGSDGLSAYEIWLNLGHIGSEEDFINFLKGARGLGVYSGEMLPSTTNYLEGDLFLITKGDALGSLYKVISNKWQLQVNLISGMKSEVTTKLKEVTDRLNELNSSLEFDNSDIDHILSFIADYEAPEDLANYQTKIDKNLQTEDKSIVGGINELKQELEGKANSNHVHENLQPKEDSKLSTKAKTIVGGINELKTLSDNNTTEITKIKRLEENTASTIVTDKDFTVVEQTSNGYFEDVKLEGKTLVNQLCTTGTNKTQTFPNNLDFAFDKNKIKLNTIYTVIVECLDNQSTEAIRFSGYNLYQEGRATKMDGCDNNDGVAFSVGSRGIYTRKFGYKTLDLEYKSPSITLFSANATGTARYNIMVLEGDHTQNPPSYFEGLQSVGEDVEKIEVLTRKEDGNLIDDAIKPNVLSDVFIPKGSYVASCKATSGVIRYYRQDGSNIDYWSMQGEGTIYRAFTTNEDIYKILFDVSEGATELQIVQGAEPVPYKPHKQDKKQLLYLDAKDSTWKKPVLREWDTVEKHSDGKYYYHKRSEKVVLNGSRNWHVAESSTANFKIFYLLVNENTDLSIKQMSNIICNSYNYNPKIDKINQIAGGNSYAIQISESKDLTIETFKQKLQANPITVVYQLAEEEVYECTNIDLITYQNQTNYIVESGFICPRTTLKVHNNIANVVTLLQKKVSLLENKFIDGLKQVLAGDMQSLAYILYPEDFSKK